MQVFNLSGFQAGEIFSRSDSESFSVCSEEDSIESHNSKASNWTKGRSK
jgi:hypothetical protein